MTLAQILGYAAALLLIVSFAMATMTWLRWLAIASAAVLGIYAVVTANWAVLAIAVILAAVNVWRLAEVRRVSGATRAAAAGAGAPVTVDWLLPYMEPLAIPKDHVIFRKGDVAESLYFVENGRVGIPELGIEIGKGNLFGEIGVFSADRMRTGTAVALEHTRLLQVSADRIRELFYKNPDFGFFLVGIISRRLVEDIEKARAASRPAEG
jgi:CRP/FNR family cyclic AMP-dependent transcriptional regulator